MSGKLELSCHFKLRIPQSGAQCANENHCALF
jgi:hypothetical protein